MFLNPQAGRVGPPRALRTQTLGSAWAEEQEQRADACLADSSSKKLLLPLVQESRFLSHHKAPPGHSGRKEPIKIPRSSRPASPVPEVPLLCELCCTHSFLCEDGELTQPCMGLPSLGAHITRLARPQPLAGEHPGWPQPVCPAWLCLPLALSS